jgi:hypothetical protein
MEGKVKLYGWSKMIKVLTPLEQAIKGKTEIDRELLRVFRHNVNIKKDKVYCEEIRL